MSTSTYPVRVRAELDPTLSRWQWLVKWLLVLPHYLVLAFLWVAFLVLSVVAFFAILFTGRYPRGIFEFNVGVLRWSWRVTYYAYGALGTDRYPPFTLHERPDYPAHLDVEYPEHLSRGLVLVKWWLLALPHYLVVALFVGGAGYAVGRTDGPTEGVWAWGSGLIGLLVLVAAVVLLFTGRYPRPVFDFVLGMNRWVLRVAAYAALMTDQYPPFRLDQGGGEHASGVLTTGSPTPPPPYGTAVLHPDAQPAMTPGAPVPGNDPGSTGVRWSTGRVTGVVLASLLAMTSVGLTAAGVTVLAVDELARDDAGFVMSPEQQVRTETFAVVSDNLEVYTEPVDALPDGLLGEVKVTVDSEAPAFVGVAATAQVERYLAGVAHETVQDLSAVPQYLLTDGGAPPSSPAQQDFWVVASTGTGTQELTWELTSGDWTVVVMNADGSAGLQAAVTAGAEVPVLGWLAPLLLSLGGTGLLVAAIALTMLIRGASRRPSREPGRPL